MSTTYPATRQIFNNPSGTNTLDAPSHSTLHANVQDTVVALEDTVGTTLGTNVLKNFVAGDFPARINSSGVVQQQISGSIVVGTIDNGVFGTPAITGGTIANALIGTSTITGGTASGIKITSGTINNVTMGSPAITGGTITTPTMTSPIINQFGTASGLGASWGTYAVTSNLTEGNGVKVGKYNQIGKLVNFNVSFTLGTSSAMVTSPTFSLPVTKSGNFYATSKSTNTGTASYWGPALSNDGTSVTAYVHSLATYLVLSIIGTNVPHVWKATDVIEVNGYYEATQI